jgi:hypothetical protein
MDRLIREIDWAEAAKQFQSATPFNHVIIDNFFLLEIADEISNEFPDYNEDYLGYHSNPLENKKVMNRWDKFPKRTYQAFTFLGREEFLHNIRSLVGFDFPLWMDYGLNGGGYHMHSRGGNNNVHLDYNIHPKLGEQRKLNIIIYMTKDWKPEWNGGLEIWTNNPETKQPGTLDKLVENVYNRAVIFDTTQNSWHGLPKQLTCPDGVVRKSLAAYYVRPAPANADPRGKALFAPTEEQKNDPAVLELIKKRSSVETASEFHKNNK